MKLRIILATLVLMGIGCGQDEFAVDISSTTIVWQGYVNEDAALLQIFEETMACLNILGVYRDGYPYIIIVNDPFLCGGNVSIGCTVFDENTIYLTKTPLVRDPTQYTSPIISHETVHWVTQLGNAFHDSIYFSQCGSFNESFD